VGQAQTLQASARIDREGRLVEADEPLAGFHRRSGGELPGALVTPGLLEIVNSACNQGLRLSRRVQAQDDREAVSMWVEARPDKDGCQLLISNWQADALTPGQSIADDSHRDAISRQMSQLSVRLGAKQEIVAIESHAPALEHTAKIMATATGKPWTDFVNLQGNAHHQPMHWRLLDGAKLTLDCSQGLWTAHLVPLGLPEPGSAGFELHLVSASPTDEPAPADSASNIHSPVGLDREIAPVLRQPVSRIIANAETIRTQLAGPLAEEYSNYAADIAAAGEHLLALIDDLTTLDMIEDEDFSPAPDRIDLGDIARRASGILGMRAKGRGISVDAPKPGESVPAIGEFRRALQILLNLIGNAISYSPEGGQVWVRAETEQGLARITVADQGEGLTDEECTRIFEKFERLGRSGDGGSGLGLYISRRLAEAMHGTLTVESAKGQGARFTLTLPEDEGAA